jgi:RND superfamily putative drug exporter
VGAVALTGLSIANPGVFANRFNAGSSQSARAIDVLRSNFPVYAGDTAQVVFKSTAPVTSPAVRAEISATLSSLTHLRDVAAVRSPLGPGGESMISRNGHIAYAVVQFGKSTDDLSRSAINAVIATAQAGARPGVEVELEGAPISKVQPFKFGAAESTGVVAALIILLVAFGSVIAAGLPLLMALFGLVAAFAVLDFMSRGLSVPTFGPELAAMIGIGVGIDYALFVVTRYRTGLADGLDPETAVGQPMKRRAGLSSSLGRRWSCRCWACSFSAFPSSMASRWGPSPQSCLSFLPR